MPNELVTVPSPKKFNILEYLTHEDLQYMFPVDYEYVKNICIPAKNLISKLEETSSESGYRTVGNFISGCTNQELYDWLVLVEDPKQYNDAVMCGAILSAVEGETFISWTYMDRYLKLFNFYLAIALIARSISLSIDYNSFTMNASETIKEPFKV